MSFDFTTAVNRRNTGSAKWEKMFQKNPHVDADVVPLSTADMELPSPSFVREGLKDYLENAVLGYTIPYPTFQETIVSWYKERHNWSVSSSWFVHTQGVVAALYTAVRAFTKPGDGVLLFRPVYPPFGSAIKDNERVEVNVPLLEEDGHYTIDFEAFEREAAKPENKLLLFCSPHNPVGRVWTKEELARLAEIAVRHQLLVVADEIWHDLILPNHTHTILATVSNELTPYLITCTAPSKTFNLAGMGLSTIIIEDESLRTTFRNEVGHVRGDLISTLGYKATEIAYREGASWVDAICELIETNQRIVQSFFQKYGPMVHAPLTEGTYVQWVDMRALNLNTNELEAFLTNDAQFFPDYGITFGKEGDGFIRINVALPTTLLQTQLNRLGAALQAKGF